MTTNIFEIVKDRIDIIDVISEDEQLQKSSRGEWYGSHSAVHDSTGKRCLFVDDTKQVWKCFNCGEGGSVIDYVMTRDNCKAIEAVNWLCERYNIPRQNWTPEQKAKFEADRKEKKAVRPLLKECFKWYHDSMTSEQRNYYHERGLTNQTIDSEWLGYAPSHNELWRYMIEKYPDQKEQLLKTGLFFKNYDGSCKDRYSDRYVMPYWYRDEIVFSIGRSIDPNIESYKKYVKHLTNSDKYPYVSNVAVDHRIYGEDLVRGADEIVITEGIFDALLAKQAGYTVISPITVKFSNKDNERLAELCQNAEAVYLLNDNEESGAGEAGAVKTAKVLAGAGVNVKLGIIPRTDDVDKIDLADFIQEAGDKAKEEVDKLLADAVDLLTYQLNQIPHDIDKMELFVEIETLLRDALDTGKDKDFLRVWLDSRIKTQFGLTARTIQNYQTMLTRVSDDVEQAQKEQALKDRQKLHEQKMEKLKKTDTAKYLKELVKEARNQSYVKAFQIKQDVSHIILADMTKHGKFYKTDTDHYYYFDDDTLKLVEIGDTAFAHYTDLRYRLNSTEIEYEYLLADLEAYSYQYGELTEVFRFAHYDRDRQTLYIDRNDCHMYRLNGETIELLNNGADNVLFISSDNEPFELVDIGDRRFIYPLIIEPTNFIQSNDVNLNKTEQQYLLAVWLDCLFFEELQPTKPILLFLGEKGSGKTTRQKTIGLWLKGKNFNVQSIGDKEDSFDATITGNYLASFDNVDTYKKWLNDRLAQVATGQRIEKRELYTTNKIARYFPRCFVTLNSREPKFKRDDVVDRLLLFRVQRLEAFKSEGEIEKEILDNRNSLWSELLHELNTIVKALQHDHEPFTSSYRMADFAKLGWQISKSQGAGDLWLELLDKMAQDKSEFLLLDDPIFQIVDGIVSGGGELNNMTSGQLYKAFKKFAEDDEIEFDFIKSAQSLAVRIGHIMQDLRNYFDVKRVKPNHRSGYLYTIKLKDSNS